MAMNNQPQFRETQYFRQWWLWGVVVLVTLLAWVSFIQQIIRDKPFGNRPSPDWAVWLIWLAFGIAFPIGAYLAHLTVEVQLDRIRVRYAPFFTRTILLQNVESYAAREYDPIREYGGWGIRLVLPYFRGKGKAYNVSGNQGVQFVLRSGEHLLIGTQHPAEFIAALDSQRATNS